MRELGFTWIELLFVLIITFILYAVCYPSLQKIVYETEDDVLKNQILNVINDAQSQADVLMKRVTVCQSNNQLACANNESIRQWLPYQIVFVDENESGASSQILHVEKIYPKHGQLYWRAFPYYRQTWFFYPTGSQKTDNAAVWHCHDDELIWSVLVNKMGRARIVLPEQLKLNLSC